MKPLHTHLSDRLLSLIIRIAKESKHRMMMIMMMSMTVHDDDDDHDDDDNSPSSEVGTMK